MNIEVSELIELQNATGDLARKAFERGKEAQANKPMPNSLYEALKSYAEKSETLVDSHLSENEKDGCNYLQIRPTREGSEGIEAVEISFDNNLMEVHSICIVK